MDSTVCQQKPRERFCRSHQWSPRRRKRWRPRPGLPDPTYTPNVNLQSLHHQAEVENKLQIIKYFSRIRNKIVPG